MAEVSRVALLLFLLLLSFGNDAVADDKRAHFNYLIHCRGCHLPEAVGFPDKIPRMKEFIGYFLHSGEGREFLIRVPGVSTAALPDDEIAELMNWLITTYSVEQLPDVFVPYTELEVRTLRKNPEPDPVRTRRTILSEIAENLPSLAQELASDIN